MKVVGIKFQNGVSRKTGKEYAFYEVFCVGDPLYGDNADGVFAGSFSLFPNQMPVGGIIVGDDIFLERNGKYVQRVLVMKENGK